MSNQNDIAVDDSQEREDVEDSDEEWEDVEDSDEESEDSDEEWEFVEDSDEEELSTVEIFKVGDQNKCSICLDQMGNNVGVGWLLPCFHKFHLGCLDNLVKVGSITCPMCRQEIKRVYTVTMQ